MINPQNLIRKAYHSAFYRWLLNTALSRMIPFNLPHGFEIMELSGRHVRTRLPYKRRNWNHLRGLHACALATLSEFTTGFLLISRLGMERYRIILKRLEMDYHFQGKMEAVGTFEVDEAWWAAQVEEPLGREGVAVVVCEVRITDLRGHHLTTGRVHWQIKDWQKVKTKI